MKYNNQLGSKKKARKQAYLDREAQRLYRNRKRENMDEAFEAAIESGDFPRAARVMREREK